MPVGQVRYAPQPGNQGTLPGSSQAAAPGTFLFVIGANAFLNAGTVNAGDTVTGVSLAAHGLVIGNGTTAPLSLAPGAAGHIATSNGADWTSTGVTPWYLCLLDAKTPAGVSITAAPASGAFGIVTGFPGSEYLLSETANSSTIQGGAMFEIAMPPGYPSGAPITANVNCNYTLGAGTIGTHTVALGFYTIANAGAITQIGGSSASLPSAAADVSFTSFGTMPNVGARLNIVVTLVVQDTGGHPVTGQINSIRLSW